MSFFKLVKTTTRILFYQQTVGWTLKTFWNLLSMRIKSFRPLMTQWMLWSACEWRRDAVPPELIHISASISRSLKVPHERISGSWSVECFMKKKTTNKQSIKQTNKQTNKKVNVWNFCLYIKFYASLTWHKNAFEKMLWAKPPKAHLRPKVLFDKTFENTNVYCSFK